jgi:type II secretory pathway pseudopilin PulG
MGGAELPAVYGQARRIRRLRSTARCSVAFSLVELVLVVVIIGIVAAIAVPRIAGSSEKAQANAILASLEAVRDAIDHYYAEHDRFPGHHPTSAEADEKFFVWQLTRYSNRLGEVSTTAGVGYPFGPYLRGPFPVNPLNDLDSVFVRATPAELPSDDSGWIATLSDGTFNINATDEQLEFVGITRLDIGTDMLDGLRFNPGTRD